MNKRLKAYEVRDDYEGHCVIRFAANNATARREGANELDIEWENVEHCQRKPEFDQYAPGPVPADVLIEHGWWFECWHCDRRVSEDLKQEVEDDDLDPNDFDIITDGHAVYCSHRCQMTHWAERRANDSAKVALLELFEAKYPDCTIQRLHVYGQKLEPRERPHGGMLCTVHFLFPGAKYGATYEYGSPDLYVANGDIEAYRTWCAGRSA
jgi:hypothetical protein